MSRWGEGRKSCRPGKSRYLGLGGRGGSSELTPSTQWHCASRPAACLHPQTASPWRLTAAPAKPTHLQAAGSFPREMKCSSPGPEPAGLPPAPSPKLQASLRFPSSSKWRHICSLGIWKRRWSHLRAVGEQKRLGGTWGGGRGTLGTNWTFYHDLAGWTPG